MGSKENRCELTWRVNYRINSFLLIAKKPIIYRINCIGGYQQMRSLQYVDVNTAGKFWGKYLYTVCKSLYSLFVNVENKKSIITNVKWSLAPGLEKNLEKNRIRFFFSDMEQQACSY